MVFDGNLFIMETITEFRKFLINEAVKEMEEIPNDIPNYENLKTELIGFLKYVNNVSDVDLLAHILKSSLMMEWEIHGYDEIKRHYEEHVDDSELPF